MNQETKVIHRVGEEKVPDFHRRLEEQVHKGFAYAGTDLVPGKAGASKATSTPDLVIVHFKPETQEKDRR